MEFNFFRLSSHLEQVGILTALVRRLIISPRPSILGCSLLKRRIPIYNEIMEHEFESYDIDISHIKNSDKVCWQYTKDPPLDESYIDWHQANEDMYYKLSPVTEGLAVASDYIHLNKLIPSTILEWYYRLDALFDAGLGFIFISTPEGDVPIRVTLSDLKDHLGLRINTTHWDSRKFDRSIRNVRMQNHLRELL